MSPALGNHKPCFSFWEKPLLRFSFFLCPLLGAPSLSLSKIKETKISAFKKQAQAPPQPTESKSREMGLVHPCLRHPSPPGDCGQPESKKKTTPDWVLGASGRSSDGHISIPQSILQFFLSWDQFRPRPAACVASKHPHLQREQASHVQALLPMHGPQGQRAQAAASLGPGRFCLRCTFHFYKSRAAAILPHSLCQQRGAAFTRLLISQVPLLGMWLSLRVPVAAWKWTEAQRVTKRGSPCAARLPAAPGLRKGYF